MSKLTATAFSFARNGWVNYEFPTYHGPNGLTFEPMHPAHEGSSRDNPFAFAKKSDAERFAANMTADVVPAYGLRATPRQWAKFPQIFDPETGSNHQRTFFKA